MEEYSGIRPKDTGINSRILKLRVLISIYFYNQFHDFEVAYEAASFS